MADGGYQHIYKHFARGNVKWIADASPTSGEDDLWKAALVDGADYSVNLASHEFRDAAGLAAGIEEISGALTLTDAAIDGVCDAADTTLIGTVGDQCDGILLFNEQGSAATDLLAFWWDSSAGLPVTLGGDVAIQWHASGIARI